MKDTRQGLGKKIAAALVLAAFVLASVLLYERIGKPMVALVRDTDRLRALIDGYGWKGRWIYIGMVFLQVVVAIIPGEPLELAAGYVFSAWEGTLLCLAGAALGSMAVFGLVRLLGRRLVEVFFSREKLESLKLLQNPEKLFWITATLMILPGTPKDLLTYAAGLTPISFGAWMLISTLGRIPSVITSTLGGHALAEGRYLYAALVFLGTALLAGAGLAVYARVNGHRERPRNRRRRAMLAAVGILLAAGLVSAIPLAQRGILSLNRPTNQRYPVRGLLLDGPSDAVDFQLQADQAVRFAYFQVSGGPAEEELLACAQRAVQAGLRVGWLCTFRAEGAPDAQLSGMLEWLESAPGTMPPAIDAGSLAGDDGAMLREAVEAVRQQTGRTPVLYGTERDVRKGPEGSALWIRNVLNCPSAQRPWRFWSYAASRPESGFSERVVFDGDEAAFEAYADGAREEERGA